MPLLVVLGAFALRAYTLPIESLWRDEVDTIRFALDPPGLAAILGGFAQAEFNGPLYLLIMRGWLILSGTSDFALRYSSLLCGVILAPVVYALGTALLRRRAGLLAMWLCAIAPVELWYGGEGKMYTLQPLLLGLALYGLYRAVAAQRILGSRGSWRWWTLFVVSTSASYYTHLLSPLFLPVAGIALALWRAPANRMFGRGALISFGLVSVPYLPLVVWQLPIVLQGRSTGHAAYGFEALAQTLALNWSYGLHGFLPVEGVSVWWLVGIFWLAAPLCLGLFRVDEALGRLSKPAADRTALVSGSSARVIASLLAWLFLPSVMLYAISLRSPVFEPRYVLWCAPALYLLLGGALAALLQVRGKRVRLQLTSGCGLLVLVSAIALVGDGMQWSHPIRPDLRGAAGFMRSQIGPQDAVVYQIPYTVFAFEHYMVRTAVVIDGPFTNNGLDGGQVGNYLTPRLAGAQRAWLVESEAALWDERGVTRAWMELGWRVVQRAEFYNVIVTLFERQ